VATALLEVEPRLRKAGGAPAPETAPFRYGAVGRKAKGNGRAEIGGVKAGSETGGCMFGLFKSEPFRDGQLGEFRHPAGVGLAARSFDIGGQ